jgi:enamine deaminase RidA (YjgF/YER057c/UK114 family)
MSSERLNPASLYESTRFGFSHAAIDTANGVVHCAGQVGWNSRYEVEGDLAAQTRQALANLKTVLEDAGSGIAELLRLRTYIVANDPDKLGVVVAELISFYGNITPAPNTVVGVPSLALPDFLVEIEATAVIRK